MKDPCDMTLQEMFDALQPDADGQSLGARDALRLAYEAALRLRAGVTIATGVDPIVEPDRTR
jgi:hypothetical protein